MIEMGMDNVHAHQSVTAVYGKQTLRFIRTKTLHYRDLDNFRIDGTRLKGVRATWAPGSFKKINPFMHSTLLNLGGSETFSLEQRFKLARYGGGKDDQLLYLKKYNRNDYNEKIIYKIPVSSIVKQLGFSRGCISPFTLEEAKLAINVNLDANPGPSFATVGCYSKLDGYDLIWRVADCTLSLIETGGAPCKPRYGLSGRPKLTDWENIFEKKNSGTAVGRAVWMADAHEPALAAVFTAPLMELFKRTQHVIMLGYNKFGPDVERLMSRLRMYDTYVVTDIKSLDCNIRNSLIHRAFSVVKYIFGLDVGTSICALLDWLRDQYIESVLVLPDGIEVVKPGGGPSGSGFIGIINSFVVSICFIETMSTIYNGKFDRSWTLNVYGDNTILSFKTGHSDPKQRKFAGMNLFTRFKNYLFNNYKLETKPSETRICPYLCVRYGQPRVPESMRDLSSDAIRDYRQTLEQRMGRKLTHEEKVDELAHEPVGPIEGGRTHRWTYIFADCVCFLSYYFKENYTMIRPTSEVIDRLLHPERNVSTLEQHELRLRSALVENQNNQHTVNRIMHYMFDARWMRRQGIMTSLDAKEDILKCISNPPIPSDRSTMPFDTGMRTGRAWYRKMRKVVTLESEPTMQSFFMFWTDVLKSAREAFDPALANCLSDRALKRAIISGSKGLSNLHISRSDRSLKDVVRFLNYMGVVTGRDFYNNVSKSRVLTYTEEELDNMALAIVSGTLSFKGPPPTPESVVEKQMPV